MDISVVIPVYNEVEALPELYRALTDTLDRLPQSAEVIFADDGSKDGSAAALDALAESDPRVRVLHLSRNYGQTAALMAAIGNSTGEVIIPMDGDGQNDPADIPRLLAKLAEGFDVVSGWRKDRKDKAMTRRLPSRIANWLIGRVGGLPLHDYGCTLKAYRREFLEPVRLYGEMHRFIPIYAKWSGARVTEMVVTHHPRREGKSKYGLGRTLKVVLDLTTVKFLGDYSTKPLYFFGRFGIILCLLGVLCGVVTIVEKLIMGAYAHANPLLLLGVMLFIVGMQLVGMGLLAELQVRTYHESQQKPTYLIAEEVNACAALPASSPASTASTPPPSGG
jgi:glycosyltransferase involved in cell wall biosynthesis